MTPEQKNEIKKKIKLNLTKAKQEQEALEAMTQPITPENSIGRISRMDAINNKSVAEASLRNVKKRIGRLQTALSKIDDPGFGVCSNCKKEIQEKRLLFMPESTLCIRCAAR